MIADLGRAFSFPNRLDFTKVVIRMSTNDHLSVAEEAVLTLRAFAELQLDGNSSPGMVAMPYKLQFLAENLAGEAGAIAARAGLALQVPKVLLDHPELVAAYCCDFQQEDDYLQRTWQQSPHQDRV